MAGTKRQRESSVELAGIEGVIYLCKLSFGLRFGGCAKWCRECGRREVDVEECVKSWDGGDGSRCEGCPRTDLTNVPPGVLCSGITDVNIELTD